MQDNEKIDYGFCEELGGTSFALVGIDEVGRGPLAGPVVACAVSLESRSESGPDEIKLMLNRLLELGVSDSKKISAKKRQKLLSELSVVIDGVPLESSISLIRNEYFSINFSICAISNNRIDEINILNASLEAMKFSFLSLRDEELKNKLLVDGNKEIPGVLDDQLAVVKGDSKSILIGLASIIAKEYRDNFMADMDLIYPGYGLADHAGYPTKSHREAIESFGVTPIHRVSFKGVKEFV